LYAVCHPTLLNSGEGLLVVPLREKESFIGVAYSTYVYWFLMTTRPSVSIFLSIILAMMKISVGWSFSCGGGRRTLGQFPAMQHRPTLSCGTLLEYPEARAIHFLHRRIRTGRVFRLYSSSQKDLPPAQPHPQLKLLIPTAEDMEDIGGLLASVTLEDKAAAAGGIIFLKGDLGAGKTAFARGFLRAATGDADLRVTSPTYLLSNTYLASAAEGGNKNMEWVSATAYFRVHCSLLYFGFSFSHRYIWYIHLTR